MTTERATDNKSKSTTRRSQQTVLAPAVAAPQGVIAGPEMLEMQGAIEDIGAASPTAVLNLQRTAGNRAVQRLIAEHVVQTKLSVGPAHDKYEDEADRTAAAVMRMPASDSATPTKLNDDEIRTSRTESEAGFDAGSHVEQRLAANKGSGSPLSDGTRSFMESRFGSDFSGVRIHTGQESDQLNRSMQAQAFTHGSDIYFGDGKYNPGSNSGKQLLAHELTHVVQQTGAVSRRATQGELPFNNRLDKDVAKLSRQLVQRDDTEDDDDEDDESGELTPENISAKIGSKYPLSPDTDKALTAAEKANPGDYALIKPVVKAYMPEAHQKKVNDVQGFFQKVKGKNLDLRDYLRAFLLNQYANVLYGLYTDPEKQKAYPTDKAKEKRRDKTYLPKALETRDKYKPLLKMGISAPETQAFLKSQSFDTALPLNEEEKAAQIAGGPRIDVRSTFIGMKFLGMGVRAHLFIVYTSSDGRQMYYRGGPGEDGNTVADMGDYVPSTVDWDPSAPSKTILEGDKAKSKADALAEATSVIDGLKVPYVGFTGFKDRDGENCNATAWTILDRAGIPKQKPSGFHPGWGHILGGKLNQGTGAMAARETEAEEDVLGYPQLLKGDPGTNVQIYADRAGAEKLTELPGGTEVDMIRDTRFKEDTNLLKIRFGDKKTGYVKLDDVEGRSGKPYQVAGDDTILVPVYELNALRANGDVLTGGDPISVVDNLPVDPAPVRIWYEAGGESRIGRISSAYVTERVVPKPTFDPADYPAGERRIPVTSAFSLDMASTPDGPLDQNMPFDPSFERELVVTLTDDLTRNHGRAMLKVYSTTYYVPLDALPLKVEAPEEEDPLVKYAYIENKNYSLPITAGKKLITYPDEESTAATEYVADGDYNLRIKVYDMVKEHGRCKVDVMGTGRYFYVALDDLFLPDGQPSAAIERVVFSEPTGEGVVDVVLSEGGGEVGNIEEHDESLEDDEPPDLAPVETGPTTEAKLEAYNKAKQVFGDYEGLDLAVIMSGALHNHELTLALQYKEGVAEELAELSQGHLTADEIRRWVRGD